MLKKLKRKNDLGMKPAPPPGEVQPGCCWEKADLQTATLPFTKKGRNNASAQGEGETGREKEGLTTSAHRFSPSFLYSSGVIFSPLCIHFLCLHSLPSSPTTCKSLHLSEREPCPPSTANLVCC